VSLDDARRVAAILAEAARAEIMPRFRNLSADAVRQKTDALDLVTEADEAAERRITAALHAAFPGCVVVGEEAASADPSLLDRLHGAGLAFVVDPVDGTANFAAGLPLFGVMTAAIVRGETRFGVIHDPVSDDHAIAAVGEGAWIEGARGRRRLAVAPPAPLNQLAGNASWRFLSEPLKGRTVASLPKLAAAWDYRCSAHEYRMTADGHGHYLLFNRLMPWDHAAGVLLHAEAGGYAARFDGSPYAPTATDGGLICAPDAETWRVLREVLVG
jgi:fructose-1,6-bisphosphatase/inositol monophosphatase family enzyme